MAESLIIHGDTRAEKYSGLNMELGLLLQGETNLISRLALIAGCIYETFDFLWVGFYLIDEATDSLCLGPYQGPLPCLRIARGRGVCGAAWAANKLQIVQDVDQFPGHIACSSLSRSEIVLPFYSQHQMAGVLDIDSQVLGDFNESDGEYLKLILQHAEI